MIICEHARCDATMRRLTSNQHHTDGEDLLCICVWGYIAKPHRCETAECEVEGSDVT
jgi:hypothetical protein